MIDVEDGAEHEFGLIEGVGEVGDIGEIAVGHTYYVVDAEGGLAGKVGVAAVVEILFIGVEVTGRSIRMKTGLVGGGVEVAAEEDVISWGEAKALGCGNRFGEEDTLEEGSDVRKREVVGSSEIVGFGDDAATDLVGATFENAAEGARIGYWVELDGFLIKGIALGSVEADGVSVAVGGSVAGGETSGNADIRMAELGEAFVEGTLTKKFVKAVVGDVVTDEKHPLDVVANGSSLVGIGRGGEGDRSLTAVGSAGGHDGAAGYVGFVEVIQLFEREGYYGKFDQTGGVEVLAGIEVVGVGSKSGAVLGVAVNLGVDNLELVLGIGSDAG